MSLPTQVLAVLKRHFFSGVLVVVPMILTYIVIRFLFESVDGILQPFILNLFGYYVPGLGLITTLMLIFLAGFFTTNIIGHRLYRVGDNLLVRLPIIRPIYSAAKQLLEAITTPSTKSFKEVGLVEYPRRGSYALCFISNRFTLNIDGSTKPYLSVFVPSTPTPVSGMVVVVPKDDVYTINMTVEEGIKFLVSGGVVSPAMITNARKKVDAPNNGVDCEAR